MLSVLKLYSIVNRWLIIFTLVLMLSITKVSFQVCLDRTLPKTVIASLQSSGSLHLIGIRSSKGTYLFLV